MDENGYSLPFKEVLENGQESGKSQWIVKWIYWVALQAVWAQIRSIQDQQFVSLDLDPNWPSDIVPERFFVKVTFVKKSQWMGKLTLKSFVYLFL